VNILFLKSRIPPEEKGASLLLSPPLGLAYLIGMLERDRPGRDRFQVLDLRLSTLSFSEEIERLDGFKPEVVAVSSYAREIPAAVQFLSLLKERDPDFVTVLGGPHVSSVREEALRSDAFDFAVQGEGEYPFLSFLTYQEGNGRMEDVENLLFRGQGGIVANPVRAYLEDLDALPFPRWSAVNLDAYAGANELTGRGAHAPLLTSRGCPFHCAYCCHTMGTRFRAHSPERVVDEMETLVRAQTTRTFEVIDENFGFDPDRAERICDRILEKGLEVRLIFPNGLRLDRLTERLVDKLKRAGTVHIAAPFDSGSPRMQKALGRNLDLARAEAMTRTIIRKRIFTVGYFMVGFPGETAADFHETVQLASRIPFHFIRFFRAVVFPGTPLAREVDRFPDPSVEPEHYDYDYRKLGGGEISREMVAAAERRILLANLSPVRLWNLWRAYPHRSRFIFRAFRFARDRFARGVYRKKAPGGKSGNVSAALESHTP